MRIALMIEGQEGVTWEQWLALAIAAEAAGLDGLFRSDHYQSIVRGGPAGSLDAWTTLAAIAARTERRRRRPRGGPAAPPLLDDDGLSRRSRPGRGRRTARPLSRGDLLRAPADQRHGRAGGRTAARLRGGRSRAGDAAAPRARGRRDGLGP